MFKPIDATALNLEASRVRGTLEKHRREFRSHPLLSRFPLGSCGAAVELLGHWLIQRGFDGVLVTVCNAIPSHVWNEVAGTVADITADQFPDGPGPVYIGELTPFHARFEVASRRPPTIENALDDSAYRVLVGLLQ